MPPTQSLSGDNILLLAMGNLEFNGESLRDVLECAYTHKSSLSTDSRMCIPLRRDEKFRSRGEGYGLYWGPTTEDDDASGASNVDQCMSMTSLSSLESDACDSSEIPKFSLSSRKFSSSDTPSEDVASIVFAFENNLAPVSCRSFECLHDGGLDSTEQVFISIGGFRIVQDFSGERAEYKIILILDCLEYIGWKSFTDFEKLALACREFSKSEESSHWLPFFESTMQERQQSETIDLRESILAWEKVLEHRFWNWYQNPLSVKSLMEETGVLEVFLKNFLFEIPDPSILLEFVA